MGSIYTFSTAFLNKKKLLHLDFELILLTNEKADFYKNISLISTNQETDKVQTLDFDPKETKKDRANIP